jgi:hypothetical protein
MFNISLYISFVTCYISVSTAISMKNIILWSATPCSSWSHRRFGGMLSLFSVRRVSESMQSTRREQQAERSAWRSLRLWRWRQYVRPKRRWTPAEQHGVTPKKAVLFGVIAVRTSERSFVVLRALICTFIHSSMILQPFVRPWPLLQFRNLFYTDGRTPWTSDQPVARPLPTHRTTQTQNKRTHRRPYLEWDKYDILHIFIWWQRSLLC